MQPNLLIIRNSDEFNHSFYSFWLHKVRAKPLKSICIIIAKGANRKKPHKAQSGSAARITKGIAKKKEMKKKRNERESAAANVLQNNKQNNKSKYEIIMPDCARGSRGRAAASEKGKQDSPRNVPGSRCARRTDVPGPGPSKRRPLYCKQTEIRAGPTRN